MLRHLIKAMMTIAILSSPASANAPVVASDIAPIYSLVARVMEGVGTPGLMINRASSPHNYALRPSEAKLISTAQVIFWVGDDLTPWLGEVISNLADENARVVNLISGEGIKILEYRNRKDFDHDEQHHGEQHHYEQHHGEQHHDEQHHGEQHHYEQHHGEQHHGEQHHYEQHHGEQHHDEQHHGEQHHYEQHHYEQHHGEQHHDEQHHGEQHHYEQHHGEQHHDEQHHGEQHHGEQHHYEQHHGEQHHYEQHHYEQHHGEQHHDEQHHGEQHHGEQHHDEHHHDGTKDPHIWLDPENGKAMLDIIAAVLAEIDPTNAEIYAANAKKGKNEINQTVAMINKNLAVHEISFIAFHDAYQYFERHFGISSKGNVSEGGAIIFGMAAIADLRDKVGNDGISCILTERGANTRLVARVLEGSSAKIVIIDPLGATLPLDKMLYHEVLKNIAVTLEACGNE